MSINFINKGGKTPELQDKSVTITENGTTNISADSGYDGLEEVEITVNISGSGAYKVVDGIKFAYSSVFPQNIDTSELTDMKLMFSNCSFTTIPLIDTSKVTTMQTAFAMNPSLTNVPLLDTSSIYVKSNNNQYGINDIFAGCTSLSNESLNNILRMCINMTVVTTSMKTLKRIGLTQAQATTCQGLSNYSAFTSAGWTTGY